MRKVPPLRGLQVFEAVGRRGSVTDAALELRVSPGAVSQQLRKVEAFLGVRLVERRGKCIELTSLGRTYHAEVVTGFDQLGRAGEVLERARSGSGLVVSCLPSVASKWIGRHLFDWQAAHPGANVRLIGTESEPRFGIETVDFRISYGEKGRAFDHYVELFTDWVVPACSPAFLEAHPAGTPADVLASALLGIEWDRGHRPPPGWADWAKTVGAHYRDVPGDLVFSLSSAAIDAAINGRGYVLAQLAMIADDLASSRLVIPFDRRLPLPDAYILAWDGAALEKPSGPEFRAWVVALGKAQERVSSGLPLKPG